MTHEQVAVSFAIKHCIMSIGDRKNEKHPKGSPCRACADMVDDILKLLEKEALRNVALVCEHCKRGAPVIDNWPLGHWDAKGRAVPCGGAGIRQMIIKEKRK